MLKRYFVFLGPVIFIVCILFYIGVTVDTGFTQMCSLHDFAYIGHADNYSDFEALQRPSVKYDEKIPVFECIKEANKVLDENVQIIRKNVFFEKYPDFYIRYTCACETSGKFYIGYSSEGRQQSFKSWDAELLEFRSSL